MPERHNNGAAHEAWGPDRAFHRLRPLRLAELVAGAIRDRILAGDLDEGDALPGLEELGREVGVSPPSMREALRILENEGLITVRRGSLGGAIVHRPKAESAAYMLGLALQNQKTPVIDMTVALAHLESLCFALCAGRADRATTLVPALREQQEHSAAVIDDIEAFTAACHRFHDEAIQGCGNESLSVAVGALEWLWRHQKEAWGFRVASGSETPSRELRERGLAIHEGLLAAITAGDVTLTDHLARQHLLDPSFRGDGQGSPVVRATDIALGAAISARGHTDDLTHPPHTVSGKYEKGL